MVSAIQGLTASDLKSAQVQDSVLWLPVAFQVPGKLSINNKVDGKNTLWQVDLTFKTCEEIDVDGHWVYLVVLADGNKLVIGSGERPYAVTTFNLNIPDNMSDSQLAEIHVSLLTRDKPAIV